MKGRAAYALARLLVLLASVVVPARYRRRFREEWEAELFHARERGTPNAAILRRAVGVFEDGVGARRLLGPSTEPEAGRRSIAWDLRLAARSLVKRPGSSLFVVLTLGAVIGANTAIFGLVHAVLLEPLRYSDPERLVKIQGRNVEAGSSANLSAPDFYDLQSESRAFESMGAHGWVGFFTVSGGVGPERVAGSNVTAGFFPTLGVTPALGRVFREDDDRPGAPATVLVAHAFWKTRLGGAKDVVGRALRLNDEPHEIIGVLPEDYFHPEPNPEREPLVYAPYQFDRSTVPRSGRFLRAVGRLAGGFSIDDARTELTALARRLEETYPQSNTGRSVELLPLKEAIVADSRTGIIALYGAVLALLLIACVNLANLQLARGSARRRALAIQTALGARRSHLVRQLLAESFLQSLAGGGLGLLLAASIRALLARPSIPRAVELELDAAVLGFGLLLSCLTPLLFGLVPALSLSGRPGGSSLSLDLSSGSARGASSRSGRRGLLVGLEMALCLPLLVGAGLFLKSLDALRSVGPGFRPDRVLTVSVSLPLARYPEGDQIPFYAELHERIRALPGVAAAGATNILPLTDNYSTDGFQIDDRPVPEGEKPSAEARSVTPGYFAAMGIPLLRGRLFDERDRPGSPGVVVVSEAMAKRFWPGEEPLGKRITYNRAVPDDGRREVGGTGSREIVGIVGNVKHLGLGDADVPMFYTPHAHVPSFHTMTLVVRTAGERAPIEGSIARELAALDPEIPMYSVRSLDEVLDRSVDKERVRAQLVGVFAAAALTLAVIGVYGVMGLVVSEREREIGIRMALGARARHVVSMLVAESLRPVVFGLAAGAVLSLLLTRLVSSLLFQVRANDPATYVEVSALLVAAAATAALLPTLRGARVDPVKTLRAG